MTPNKKPSKKPSSVNLRTLLLTLQKRRRHKHFDSNKKKERFLLDAKECSHLSSGELRSIRESLRISQTLIENELEAREARQKQCVICLDTQRTVLLMPCKHLVCCDGCAMKVNRCPICRTHIYHRITIFLS